VCGRIICCIKTSYIMDVDGRVFIKQGGKGAARAACLGGTVCGWAAGGLETRPRE